MRVVSKDIHLSVPQSSRGSLEAPLTFSWRNHKKIHADLSGAYSHTSVMVPRIRQLEAFTTTMGANVRIIKMPTGSGKSLVAKMLAIHDMWLGKKTIITVPQKSIGAGFAKDNDISFSIDGVAPVLPHRFDLSADSPTFMVGGEIDDISTKIISYLLSDEIKPLVTTNAALALVYKKLSSNESLEATSALTNLYNASFIVDEAHRIKWSDTATNDEEESNVNYIGRIIRGGLSSGNMRLTLITATYFRADRFSIVPADHLNDASVYTLPFDTFMEDAGHEGIVIGLSLFKKNPLDAISSFNKKRDLFEIENDVVPNKHFEGVYIPVSNSVELFNACIPDNLQEYFLSHSPKWSGEEWSSMAKKAIVGKIWEQYGNELPTIETLPQMSSTVLHESKLDMVDDSPLRDQRYAYLANSDLNDPSKHPSVIAAMSTCKEGTDFPLMDTVHIVGTRHIGEMVQIVGRTFRKRPNDGKRIIFVNLIIPELESDGADFIDGMNRYFDALFLTMLMEDIFTTREVEIDDVENIVDGSFLGEAVAELSSEESDVSLDRMTDEQLRTIDRYVGRRLSGYKFSGMDSINDTFDRQACIKRLNDNRVDVLHILSGIIDVSVFKLYKDFIEQKDRSCPSIIAEEMISFYKENGRWPPRGSHELGKRASGWKEIRKSGERKLPAAAREVFIKHGLLEEFLGDRKQLNTGNIKDDALEMVSYYKVEGRWPPRKAHRLGTKVNTWRQAYKKGKLPEAAKDVFEVHGLLEVFVSDQTATPSMVASEAINYFRLYGEWPVGYSVID